MRTAEHIAQGYLTGNDNRHLADVIEQVRLEAKEYWLENASTVANTDNHCGCRNRIRALKTTEGES